MKKDAMECITSENYISKEGIRTSDKLAKSLEQDLLVYQ